jgi:hypothetical protein
MLVPIALLQPGYSLHLGNDKAGRTLSLSTESGENKLCQPKIGAMHVYGDLSWHSHDKSP